MPKTHRRHRLLLAAAAVTAVTAIAPAAARAGVLVASAGSCEQSEVSRPFLPWADIANYVPAPGGACEGGAPGWTLAGAAVVAGNEPWKVRNAADAESLSIRAAGSATSAAMCVGIEHPTLRFFAKGGDPLDVLRVEVLFEDALGGVHAAPIGAVPAGSWRPTAPFPVVVNLLPLLPGEHTAVAFRFTAVGTGAWAIDDVYVDPYARY